jgi:hypothetical protein
MRYVHTQSGAALIVLLTIFILGSLTFLLSEANDRSHYLVEDQEQTIRALAQAKESLLGFAATYAQTHEVKLQGYLPCPDNDGDGSATRVCDMAGQTVLGRLPWRTLGLPPLRDGSGECLWYAVSGNFKNNPQQVLTSDSNGMIITGNAQNGIIAGDTIAVLFAPGRSLKGQEERYKTTGEHTECGSKIETLEPINHVRYYLDKYNFDGVVNDNITANNSIYYSANSGHFATPPTINVTPRFINAPPVYEVYLNPQSGTEQLDHANPTFNDTLATITPEDFRPIYRMMDYQVATQVRTCLDRYAQQSLYHFINSLQTNIRSDPDNPFIFVEKFLEITNLKGYSTDKVIQKDILDKIKASIANKKIPYPKYPWPSYVNLPDYTDDENNYFGRIPTNILVTSSFDKTTNQPHLLKIRDAMIKQLDGSTIEQLEEKLLLSSSDFYDLWSKFEEYFTILDEWPVDPQEESFSIFDLHYLEYEELEKIGMIDEIKHKVIDSLENKTLAIVFERYYFSVLTDPDISLFLEEPNISPVEDYIIAEISKRYQIWKEEFQKNNPSVELSVEQVEQIVEQIKIEVTTEFLETHFQEIDIPPDEKIEDKIRNVLDNVTLINSIKDIKYILEIAADLKEVVDPKLAYLRDQYQCFSDNTYIGGSRVKWWWWPVWQDKVFFAIHSDYSLNNTIENSLTFNTLSEQGDINTDMLILVAGRLLNGQERSPSTQNDITNYLEGENSDGDTHFIHAPVTSTFNDVLL